MEGLVTTLGASRKVPHFLSGLLIIIGLYLSSLYSYLLFHSLAELFSIAVACGIFMIAWNTRESLENGYLLFVGIAYLFVAGMDSVHTLAYKGMGVFPGYGANLPTQLWIVARFMESTALLIAPLFLSRKLKPYFVFFSYAGVSAVLLMSIFYWDVFPVCFVEGVGLTPFKKVSEYIISIVLFCSGGLLYRNRRRFDRSVLRLVLWSIVITIGSELSFTFYISAYGFSNLVGHFLKILSCYLVYKAIIETGLSKPYNLLLRDLKLREEELSEQREWLRVTLTSIGDAVMATDTDGRLTFINPVAERLLGYGMEEAVGRPVGSVFRIINEKTGEPAEDIVERVLIAGEAVLMGNATALVSRDGRVVPIEDSAAPIKDSTGNVAGVVVVFYDVTEARRDREELQKSREELEVRVRERTAELHETNRELEVHATRLEQSYRELEDFSFVASHDLQEPLRKIRTFSDRLKHKSYDSLGDAGRHDLERIERSAERMQDLVRDLLKYSLITSRREPFELINVKEPAEEALADLEAFLLETGGTVSIGDLPSIEADRVQMRQLFLNLIGNGLKYHGENKPLVKVYSGSSLPDGFWEICVEDNGIGFNEQYLFKILKPYQRLHGKQSVYQGTGMGLAICRRIVERHGGSIAARSEPGRGSTFVIRFPGTQRGPEQYCYTG